MDPEAIRRYMFGTTVVSDWKEGGPIVWKGEWKGKAYEDKGVILRLEPERILQYSHFSPQSGLPDTPENHHTVTIVCHRKSRDLASDVSGTDQSNGRHGSQYKTGGNPTEPSR